MSCALLVVIVVLALAALPLEVPVLWLLVVVPAELAHRLPNEREVTVDEETGPHLEIDQVAVVRVEAPCGVSSTE